MVIVLRGRAPMLTRMFSAVPSDSWPLMAGVVALSLLGAPIASAEAGGIVAGTCVRSLGSLSCVARWGESGDPNIPCVPRPRNAQPAAESIEHHPHPVTRFPPL